MTTANMKYVVDFVRALLDCQFGQSRAELHFLHYLPLRNNKIKSICGWIFITNLQLVCVQGASSR